jgi:excinuclease ABC subunit C
MNALPRRMECFDISNFQGSFPVASLVHFDSGEPVKGRYRHFRIRGIEAPNDFAMMEHVVERHYQRLLSQGAALPELVIVDGGRGQLGAARKALDRLNLGDRITLIGLAKRQEEIWKDGASQSILLPRTAAALKLLQRIRNEAHRFAIGYHRRLRDQSLVRSALDDIPGVGQKTRLALLRHFGSIEAIARADATQLAAVPGIGATTAERILAVLTHPALHGGETYAAAADGVADGDDGSDDRQAADGTPPPQDDAAVPADDSPLPEDDLEAEEVEVDVQAQTTSTPAPGDLARE